MLRYNYRYQLLLIVSDVVLVVGSLLLASYVRLAVDFGSWGYGENFITPPFLFVVAAIIWVISFERLGVYDMMKSSQVRVSYNAIVRGHIMGCLLFMGALYIAYRDFSRLQAVYFLTIMLIAVFVHRSLLRLLSGRIHQHINQQRYVLIVGANANAQRIGKVIQKHANAGLQVIGYLKAESDEPVPPSIADSLLRSIDGMAEVVSAHGIDEVLLAIEWFDQATANLVAKVIRSQISGRSTFRWRAIIPSWRILK